MLIVTAGLAAAVTSVTGVVNELNREHKEIRLESCRLAAAILQDESPSPYLDKARRADLETVAYVRLHRCME